MVRSWVILDRGGEGGDTRTVGYFAVPYQINTFYPMFYGNIYLFGTWGLSINIWMTNFDEGALWLLV